MSEQTQQQRPISWATRRDEKARRMQMVELWLKGPVLPQEKIVEALESVIVPGDRIVMEVTTRSKPISCRVLWSRSVRRRFTTYTSSSQASAGPSISHSLSSVSQKR